MTDAAETMLPKDRAAKPRRIALGIVIAVLLVTATYMADRVFLKPKDWAQVLAVSEESGAEGDYLAVERAANNYIERFGIKPNLESALQMRAAAIKTMDRELFDAAIISADGRAPRNRSSGSVNCAPTDSGCARWHLTPSNASILEIALQRLGTFSRRILELLGPRIELTVYGSPLRVSFFAEVWTASKRWATPRR